MDTNPAGEVIEGALPSMPKVKAHFRAMPYQEVGSALKTIESSHASLPAKLCFRFLILTATRSSEARGAKWNEIDLEGRVWRIPSERMKGRLGASGASKRTVLCRPCRGDRLARRRRLRVPLSHETG